MNDSVPADFRIVVVGWGRDLVFNLWGEIASRSGLSFSNLVHPDYTPQDFGAARPVQPVHFFREDLRQAMPAADRELLASLEREGVPTVHNMILGDRIVSRLPYDEALGYATFLARRLRQLFEAIRPSVIIGSYDGIHSGLTLAVARQMNIPWFALNFSVLPAGLACFSERLSAAAQVQLRSPVMTEMAALAQSVLSRFESHQLRAPAFVEPSATSVGERLRKLPRWLMSVPRTLRRGRDRQFLKFTRDETDLSVRAAVAALWRARGARRAAARAAIVRKPPSRPYVLFGLHLQPESAIDVWAPFFSNQMWVIELLSRSVPPSHALLIKIHKSDVANYSRAQLERMRSFPGVELVHSAANSREFIERADLVVGIQGTMGLEAAMLGRPVIMLGDSPVTLFPSAARIGAITDLPALVRRMIGQTRPSRDAILEAYAKYLSPFVPAGHNDWQAERSTAENIAFAKLFLELRHHVETRKK